MYSREIKIENQVGLIAKPAALFAQKACGYEAKIDIKNGERQGNAKSLLGILSTYVGPNTTITISADGEDEKAAVDGLCDLIETKFE